MIRPLAAVVGALVVLALGPAADAYDAKETFIKGSIVISPEAGYGNQFNFEDKSVFSNVEFFQLGVRFGWLPFAPAGPGPLFGSFEVGLEPLYQKYVEPDHAFFGGLGVTGRYHFLSLGRFVPYVEAAAFAGGTDLKVPEIDSSFTFVLWAGAGASVFVTDRTAIYAGYRWTHISNGNTSDPNRGIEAHTGVLGMSFFFE
jgi:opacity protein-like surface antigen